jgi:hypothetical protein
LKTTEDQTDTRWTMSRKELLLGTERRTKTHEHMQTLFNFLTYTSYKILIELITSLVFIFTNVFKN